MSAQADCTGYEFGITPVKGIRAWGVDKMGRLVGAQGHVWRPGEQEADCRKGVVGMPPAMRRLGWTQADIDRILGRGSAWSTSYVTGGTTAKPMAEHDMAACTCGFYAYHDGVSNFDIGKDRPVVHGIIEGYGKTSIGTRGFRSSKARLIALALPVRGGGFRSLMAGWSLWDRAFSLLAAFILVTNATAIFVLGFTWARILTTLSAFLWLSATAYLAREKAAAKGLQTKRGELTPDLVALVRRNYPDVQFFPTAAAMKAAFPPDKGVEPSPETDPEFWTRSPR